MGISNNWLPFCRCASLVREEDVIRLCGATGQLEFFDAKKRHSAFSKKGDAKAIAALIPWESFRAERLFTSRLHQHLRRDERLANGSMHRRPQVIPS